MDGVRAAPLLDGRPFDRARARQFGLRGVRCYTATVGDDCALADGVPVTTPLRTALDLLRWLAVGRGEVLGPSLALERGIGELLSLEPTTLRRTW